MACVSGLLLAVCASAATVPEIIEFNGTLAWSETNAPVAGVHPFTVRLYDQATGGTLLWEEMANVAVDASGRYGVQLGAGTQGAATNSLSGALELAGSSAFLELEVRINGQTRLFAPRQQLGAAPFALMAGYAHRATKGMAVEGMLVVEGRTQAGQVTAATVDGGEVVVTKQIKLLAGSLACDILTAPATNEPVVFSTGVIVTQEMRVAGSVQIFSMRKPKLTKVSSEYTSYQADTDCWLYLTAGASPITVGVGNHQYYVTSAHFYPVPIPKGTGFNLYTAPVYLELDTDQGNDRVFANGTLPGCFFMSLGVAP